MQIVEIILLSGLVFFIGCSLLRTTPVPPPRSVNRAATAFTHPPSLPPVRKSGGCAMVTLRDVHEPQEMPSRFVEYRPPSYIDMAIEAGDETP